MYSRPITSNRAASCRDLGTLVQKRLSKWSLADSNLFTGSGCDLIIVDRGHDPVAPVIHPFHYASITHDLVPMSNGVFKYTWKDAKGEEQSSEHVVDSTDSLWADLRHTHVAEVVEVANSKLKDFTNSRMARVEREGMLRAPCAAYPSMRAANCLCKRYHTCRSIVEHAHLH